MKKFNNYDKAKENAQFTGGMKLPVGAYICKIMNVKYTTESYGDVILVQYDISEGEQKGFFKKQYEQNTSDNKKYKGVIRLNVPKDDGSDQDEWTKNTFARFVDAIEKSNNGYSWDWDENKWKAKSIGIVFGETGAVIGGKEVIFVEPHGYVSVDAVKTNNFWEGYLKLKKRKGFTGNHVGQSSDTKEDNSYNFMDVPTDMDSEIPFV